MARLQREEPHRGVSDAPWPRFAPGLRSGASLGRAVGRAAGDERVQPIVGGTARPGRTPAALPVEPRVIPSGQWALRPVDAEVAALVAAGQPERAAEVAIRHLGPKIRGFLGAILRDRDLAGDAFSLFCEKLWKCIAGFRGEAPFRSWAFRVAWSAAMTVRAESRRRRAPRAEEADVEGVPAAAPVSLLRYEQQRAALAELRSSLSAEDQALLALRVEQALSWDDIALVLSSADRPRIDPATLRKRFERLKARLALLARDRGLLD
jgi:RNA polymerase sigma-70 factor (ECF subfamily)